MATILTTDDLVMDDAWGLDEDERFIGYVHTDNEDDGGFFFVVMSSLNETLESIVASDVVPPTFPRGLVRDFLERTIASRFPGEPSCDSDEAGQREARRLREEAKADRADEMRDREKDGRREREQLQADRYGDDDL